MSAYNPQDPASNTNQRSPPLTLPSKYPYIRFSQYRDGSWKRQDEYPNNSGYAVGHISGTFFEHTALSGTQQLTVNCHHNYVGAGKTTTADLNHDNKVGSSHVNRVTQDHYAEHGADQMFAIGGDHIHATGGISFTHATHGTQVSSTGDHVSDHNDGNHYVNIQGDHVQYAQGTYYHYVGGESGHYVPNGNHDLNVSNNTNFQTGSTTTIKAGTSVVITVGGTTVTITPNSVIVHDGNGNEMGMNSSKLWLGNPSNVNIPVYLGGNGQIDSLYDYVATMSGPSINVKAKYVRGSDSEGR